MIGLWPWVAFNAGVLVVLTLDLGVFHRTARNISLTESAIWSALWVSLSLIFAAVIGATRGGQAGTEFLTGYLIEYSLSVDNIFIFVLIFSWFGTKGEYQYRVLFWGILGALFMRGMLIAVGAALIATFHWVIYLFGVFLVVTGVRMAVHPPHSINPDANPVLRLVRRFVPVSERYYGQHFFYRAPNAQGVVKTVVTPLFVVLILIETMDLVFAVDSVPAVFSVTRDPFIVYTSNVCAILGLRSLYFLLAAVIRRFHYLHYGLALVLSFVGAKMLVSHWYEIPTIASLTAILAILAGSVALSFAFPPNAGPPA